ncbi:SulP family inorganic anion transporter [Methylocystis parvus]|uniref:SulP family inorganic anion transporter n=1 Tax=Methylocystis parvus TaxID=134 RepID=UPI003C739D6B
MDVAELKISAPARPVPRPPSQSPSQPDTIRGRFKLFMTLWDSRFEDLKPATWVQTTYRDFSAGLIVALTAIPMAMGFSMAMGLRPEQGIIAGALACVVGRTFGGSKYQVYGPTAAFIPVIAGLVKKYGEAGGGTFSEAHGFLVLVSIIAGVVLMGMGLFGLGKYAKLVPNSIVVGFTAGIAVAIAASNIESVLGIRDFSELIGENANFLGGLGATVSTFVDNLHKINLWAVVLGLMTFALTKILLRISIFIPAPALAIAACTALAATVLSDKGIVVVRDIYGTIPNNFFVFTPPVLPAMSGGVLFDIFYYVLAIVFVSGVESLLCSSMADRMADNRGTPFNPDKEFWGQGLVQVITPMVNGFPCTGALARTATSIKAGAITPLAGYFKGFLKLSLAYFIADYLEMVPMACIGGILLWVASNMIKVSEIKEVLNHNRFHAGLMVFTAVMVPMTDFLTGVLSALVLYFVARRFLDKPVEARKPVLAGAGTATQGAEIYRPGVFNNVAIPLALSDEDQDLLSYAAYLADIGVIRDLHFVHISHGRPTPEVTRAMAERVEPWFPKANRNRKVTFEAVDDGSRLDALVRFTLARHADLILLGHRKTRSGQRSLATRLALITHCSVWMAPEGARSTISKVLSPIDFSDRSADAIAQAVAVARAARVPRVTALHVYFDPNVLRYEEHDALVRGEEESVFRKFIGKVDTDGVAVTPKYVESSHAADAVLRQAEEEGADLIVLATRGRSKAATILLGSVASEVIRRSPIPVLAVKHYGDRMTIKDVLLSGQFWRAPEMQSN